MPDFANIGKRTDTINVLLSYRIVELFSEGLYSSPNKAIEELVANSFDAGALRLVEDPMLRFLPLLQRGRKRERFRRLPRRR